MTDLHRWLRRCRPQALTTPWAESPDQTPTRSSAGRSRLTGAASSVCGSGGVAARTLIQRAVWRRAACSVRIKEMILRKGFCGGLGGPIPVEGECLRRGYRSVPPLAPGRVRLRGPGGVTSKPPTPGVGRRAVAVGGDGMPGGMPAFPGAGGSAHVARMFGHVLELRACSRPDRRGRRCGPGCSDGARGCGFK